MNKVLIIFTIGIAMFLGGCGLKERAINLKNRIVNSDSESAPVEKSSKNADLTGMLLILDPKLCPLVEGCGPNYSLLGRSLKSQVSIAGDIQAEHQNLIVTVVGKAAPVPGDLAAQSGYRNVSAHVEVQKYRLRSSIPYYPFLTEQAAKHTMQKFGCDLLWDKSYSWSIENKVAHLIVKLTDTYGDEPQSWMQLNFNGNTGELISESMHPQMLNPCAG